MRRPLSPTPAAATERSAIRARAGIGLRFPHHQAIIEERPDIAWLEVHSENYLGGKPLATLEGIRRDYPVALHGVGLSLGSADGIDRDHLARIGDLARRIEPGLISEHLSWSGFGGSYLAELLPLPLTEEALDVVCRHVDQMQAALGRRVLIENPSSYLQYRHSTMPEWEFLAVLAARTGCGILCDVNNIFVSASNHGWSAETYLAALPPATIGEIHLAGHALRRLDGGGTLRIDDHGSPVAEEVWALYAKALARFGAVPALIEWDNELPPLSALLEEAARAEAILSRVRRNGHADAA